MATKSELQQKLEDLRGALYSPSTPENAKAKLQAEINKTEAELLSMPDEDNNEPESDQSVIDKIASVLLTTMSSGKGSGLDAPQLRQFITDYLRTDKVKLSELDQSVLDEIRKNQLVKIQLPLYDKEIEIDSATADIPNLYKIIDDILAGNNVFLVGEAGGGKTYTAEKVAEILQRKYVTLNCSQYTSPLEILGGQSVEGFKQGKLIDCWRNGKILILDEMPKLDPNTAGLFNDALAKSTKTKTKSQAKINSTNAEEPPIERNSDFGIIATGNLYPNIKPPSQYGGNSQQDLSLLDRFSGSVYYTEFDNKTDQRNTRYQFLYEFLVGNYYDYIKAKNEGTNLPTPVGLRAIIEHNGWGNLALVSYRTGTSFRIAFEYELVRYMAKQKGKDVLVGGKTLLSTFKSYMVAFGRESGATYQEVIRQTQYTDDYIQNIVDKAIKGITKDNFGFIKSLTPLVQESAKGIFESYDDFFTSNVKIESKA